MDWILGLYGEENWNPPMENMAIMKCCLSLSLGKREC